MPYSFLATAAFGLEGIVSNELKRLGYSAKAEQGCARFTGELADGFRANLCLRTADRVLLLLDEKDEPMTEADQKLAQTIATFLGQQMEG